MIIPIYAMVEILFPHVTRYIDFLGQASYYA